MKVGRFIHTMYVYYERIIIILLNERESHGNVLDPNRTMAVITNGTNYGHVQMEGGNYIRRLKMYKYDYNRKLMCTRHVLIVYIISLVFVLICCMFYKLPIDDTRPSFGLNKSERKLFYFFTILTRQ